MGKKELDIEVIRGLHKTAEKSLPVHSKKRRMSNLRRRLEVAGYRGETSLQGLIAGVLKYTPDGFLDLTHRLYRPGPWVATSTRKLGAGLTPEEALSNLLLEFMHHA